MTAPVPPIETVPVAIIGAGPVGLAAAAECHARGLSAIVLEAGDAGDAVARWGHVRMFSPWAYDVAAPARALLEAEGWQAPDPEAHPTGRDLLDRYLRPLAETRALAPMLRRRTRVTRVTRQGLDKLKSGGRAERPFALRTRDADGREDVVLARAVIDCSGTWGTPAPAGADGLPAPGEAAAAARIAYAVPDVLGAARAAHAGATTLVLGSGHSAIGVLLDLVALAETAPGTRAVWLTRKTKAADAFGGGAADGLSERGALGLRFSAAIAAGRVEVRAAFRLEAIEPTESGLRVHGSGAHGGQTVEGDRLVVATGFRPDLSLLAEVRTDLDPALEAPRVLAPLIDPNLHSCGTVRPHGAAELRQPDPGLYLAGMKSYGRAPTFLLATGYEQVRSIVAEIAGDHAAAARVDLVLPETGVCATDRVTTAVAASCCGGPPVRDMSACCASDETAKAVGAVGCRTA